MALQAVVESSILSVSTPPLTGDDLLKIGICSCIETLLLLIMMSYNIIQKTGEVA